MSSDGQYQLASSQSASNAYVYLSTNYGASFTRVSPDFVAGKSVYSVSVSQTGQYMAAAVYDYGIAISSDYGATWSFSNAGTGFWRHVDILK
jgi:hypothetical protein